MNRYLLARRVADRVDGLSLRVASAAVDAALEAIGDALTEGETVTLSGFGTFKTRHRSERHTYHPKTGVPITIAASLLPAFSASPQLRDRVNHAQPTSPNTPIPHIQDDSP